MSIQSNINQHLSEQQRMIVENIISIQDYYQLKDHRRLISVIINEKQSKELFGDKKIMISNVFEKNKGELSQEAKITIFSEKYTYEILADKFKRPKSSRNNILTEVLKRKLEKSAITSHSTRKHIWMLASGALFSMKNNKGLYQGLINYPNYPNYYDKSIVLDLHRTVKKTDNSEDEIKSLHNLLLAFSRRNPYIGYCQGLNFIAFFLLTMQFTEEQAFWILSQITETIIPMDYYTNMIGVACDQQIFLQILKLLKPNIIKKFNEVGLDASVLSIQWFVCQFTSSLPFYLVKIVWDHLLVEGTTAFMKAGLIVLSYFQKQILGAKQFYEIIMVVEQGTKNLQISEESFNAQFNKYYINKQGLKIARDLYRQFHIKDKLKQKVTNKALRPQKEEKCQEGWPLCIKTLNETRRNILQIETWTYRQQNSPKIIHDYMEIQKSNTVFTKSTIHEDKIKLKEVQYSDYVIGRMHHKCKEQKKEQNNRIEQKTQKKQKNKIKILSIVGQQEQDDRKKTNIQKILRLSSMNLDQKGIDEDGKGLEQRKGEQPPSYQDKKQQKIEQDHYHDLGMQKSLTIQFYSQFVENNKQIAQMITGKK